MPQLNMKNKPDEILYFRRLDVDGESIKVYVKEENVAAFSLGLIGKDLPIMEGHYTILQNYITFYWQHFLKSDALGLYITLKSQCYGTEKDYCFPSNALLCEMTGKSHVTVRKLLDVLEEHGFILRFYTEDKVKGEGSPIIKVRKTCPLLPSDLASKLPPRLAKMHARHIKEITGTNIMEGYFTPDFKGECNNFLYQNADLELASKDSDGADDGTINYKLRKATLRKTEIDLWENVLGELRKDETSNTPSFETFLGKGLIEYDDETEFYTIWTSNQMAYKYIYDNYSDKISEVLKVIEKKDRIKLGYDLYDSPAVRESRTTNAKIVLDDDLPF